MILVVCIIELNVHVLIDFLLVINLVWFFLFLGFWPEISEDEAEDRLQDAIQEKFAVFGDVCDK